MTTLKSALSTTTAGQFLKSPRCVRNLATQTKAAKKEGDISSVFVSLSGAGPARLPSRFADIKRQLIEGNEDRVLSSWQRLLRQLSKENEIVAQRGPNVVPQIDFKDLGKPSTEFLKEVRKRGVAVIRGVVPVDEAREYKAEVEEYVKANPWTKGAFSTHPEYFTAIKSTHADLFDLQHFLAMIPRSSNFTGLRLRSAVEHIPVSSPRNDF